MYSAVKCLFGLIYFSCYCIRQFPETVILPAILFEATEENWGEVYLLVPTTEGKVVQDSVA